MELVLFDGCSCDERDFEFAQMHGLILLKSFKMKGEGAFTGDGMHYNSGIIDGLYNEDAKKENY